jgi:uncharacterized membrane protein YgcG
MNRSIQSRLHPALLLTTGAVVAACSSGPSENVASSAAAVTQSQSEVFDGSNLAAAVTLTDIWSSSLDYSNGKLEVIPSACGLLNLSTLIPAATVTLPTAVVSEAGCNFGLSFTGLSSPSFSGTTPFGGTPSSSTCGAGSTPGSIVLTPSGVQVTIAVAGSIHADAGNGGYCFWPSVDLVVTSGTITATFAWQAASQTFTASATANINYNVTNCWAGGACDALIQGAIGNVNGELGTQITNALNKTLTSAGSGVSTALYAAFTAPLNALGTPAGDTPWAVVPGSVQYSTASGGEFTYEVSRTLPNPPAGTSCGNGMVDDTSGNCVAIGSSCGTAIGYLVDSSGQCVGVGSSCGTNSVISNVGYCVVVGSGCAFEGDAPGVWTSGGQCGPEEITCPPGEVAYGPIGNQYCGSASSGSSSGGKPIGGSGSGGSGGGGGSSGGGCAKCPKPQ